MLAFCNLPPHLHTWLSSLKRQKLYLPCWKFQVLFLGGLRVYYPPTFGFRQSFYGELSGFRSPFQDTDKLEDVGSHTQQPVNRAESLDVNNVANVMWS